MITPKNRAACILVVDDEPTITEFLEMGLSFEGWTVFVATNGHDALTTAARVRPDLVVLDIMLPGIDGIEVCRRLRAQGDVSIILLTARDGVDDRVQGLDSGADDYLAKPFRFRELLARVRASLRRRGFSPDIVRSWGELSLDPSTREVQKGSQVIQLRPREFDILELLLGHPRQVFSREAILNRIWGYEGESGSGVVEVHISSLRDKLGDHDRKVIETIRGLGYRMGALSP